MITSRNSFFCLVMKIKLVNKVRYGTQTFNMAFKDKTCYIIVQLYEKQICSDFYYEDFK